jgi:hypothetical protein
MANTFILHNREGADSTSVSMTSLEESARDRKNQLGKMLLQLKTIALHLHSITDEEIREGDLED